MPGGRPVAWDVGTAPPGIGMRPEKHDKDGRFLGDRKACEEWTDYLKNHKSTERKFDNGMTKIVREGVTDFIKKTRARTDVAVKLGELDEASAQAKKMIASNKEAIEFYNSKNDKDAQGANRLPEQPTLEDIATYLTGVVDLDATDDLCDVLKNYMRVDLLLDAEAKRDIDRKPLVHEFKNLNHEVILARDDINYLVAKMRETSVEYERDDDYELPAVDLLLRNLPSKNKTSRRDEMAAVAALASPSPASAGDDLEAQMAAAEEESAAMASSSDDDDDEDDEAPAKKRPRSDSGISTAGTASGSRVGSDPSLE